MLTPMTLNGRYFYRVMNKKYSYLNTWRYVIQYWNFYILRLNQIDREIMSITAFKPKNIGICQYFFLGIVVGDFANEHWRCCWDVSKRQNFPYFFILCIFREFQTKIFSLWIFRRRRIRQRLETFVGARL